MVLSVSNLHNICRIRLTSKILAKNCTYQICPDSGRVWKKAGVSKELYLELYFSKTLVTVS